MDESFDPDETRDFELTDTFVFDLRKISAQIRQEAEERRAASPDRLMDETESGVYAVAKTNWAQRLLGWFTKTRDK